MIKRTVYVVKNHLTGRYLMNSIDHYFHQEFWTEDPAEARHYDKPLTEQSLNRIRNGHAELLKNNAWSETVAGRPWMDPMQQVMELDIRQIEVELLISALVKHEI